jgi:hypothetical protein
MLFEKEWESGIRFHKKIFNIAWLLRYFEITAWYYAHHCKTAGKTCASGDLMNNNLKYGLFFLGGVALGAIGAVAVSRGKLDLKPLATDLISRGLEVKDAVLAKADAVREDVEDMVAEARAVSEQRKAQPEAEA